MMTVSFFTPEREMVFYTLKLLIVSASQRSLK